MANFALPMIMREAKVQQVRNELYRHLVYVSICVLIMFSGFINAEDYRSPEFWLTECILAILSIRLSMHIVAVIMYLRKR